MVVLSRVQRPYKEFLLITVWNTSKHPRYLNESIEIVDWNVKCNKMISTVKWIQRNQKYSCDEWISRKMNNFGQWIGKECEFDSIKNRSHLECWMVQGLELHFSCWSKTWIEEKAPLSNPNTHWQSNIKLSHPWWKCVLSIFTAAPRWSNGEHWIHDVSCMKIVAIILKQRNVKAKLEKRDSTKFSSSVHFYSLNMEMVSISKHPEKTKRAYTLVVYTWHNIVMWSAEIVQMKKKKMCTE